MGWQSLMERRTDSCERQIYSSQLKSPVPRKALLYAAVGMAMVGLLLAAVIFFPVGPPSNSGGTTTSSSATTSGLRFSDVVVAIEGAGDDAQYTPQVVTGVIGVNNTVVWVNNGAIPHTVTSTTHAASGTPLFDSGNMNVGAEFSYTFLQPGTYGYYCVYHGTMQGEVVVVAQSA